MPGRGRSYPAEFKSEAVELYRSSGKSIRDIASELGISPESLRRWNVQQEIDAGKRNGLTSEEREELRELRRKLRRVTMERDILKKAALESTDQCNTFSKIAAGVAKSNVLRGLYSI